MFVRSSCRSFLCKGAISALCIVLLGGVEAKDHVLIMSISQYPKSQSLPGAAIDKNSAKEIAARMGFQTDDATTLTDAQLTVAGIRNALGQLDAKVQDGDRLFIYYSGHGTSFRNKDRVCEQGIHAYDEQALASSEVAQLLSRMRDRASKVIVMLDSCYSGGVVKTAESGVVARSAGLVLTPKFVARDGEGGSCQNPTNQISAVVAPPITRGAAASKAAYNPEQNFVFISASRDNEISLDAGTQGGLFTSGMLKCTRDQLANDEDASGSISFKELVSCAQHQIAGFFPGSGEMASGNYIFKPHHVTIAGNDGMPITSPPSTPSAQKVMANPKATLQDLFNGRDATWDVQLQVSPNVLRIGKDSFRASAISKRPGYLYLVYVGSDGKEFSLLYPDSSDAVGSNRMEPSKELVIPGEFKANGPAGTDHFVAYVSPEPRTEITKIFSKDGSAQASMATAVAINQSSCATRNSSSENCFSDGASARNVVRIRQATTASSNTVAPATAMMPRDGYGAALATIIEQ